MVTPVTVMEVAVSFEKTSKSLPFCSQSCLHSWCLLRSTTTHSPIRDSICRLYTLSYLLEFCLMIFLKMTFTSPCCSVAKSCLSDSLLLHGCWAPLSSTISQNLLKFISIESVMLSNHLILCRPRLLLLQSFLASGSFPINQLFASGGQNTGASASVSVLPMNIHG